MSAIGGIGGIGGGIAAGSTSGASASSFASAPPIESAPAPQVEAAPPSTSPTWFDASSVMDTSGVRSGTEVSLRDYDLKAGIGSLEREPTQPQPQAAPMTPSAAVVGQVAATYAASRSG